MWFEEFVIGKRTEIGAYTFTADDVIAFARAYDPQPQSLEGPAPIVSGWHLCAIWMKLVIAGRATRGGKEEENRSGVSPGFLDLEWPADVRAGETIRFSMTVSEKIELRSKRDWGLVRSTNEARNEAGELVMRFTGQGFVGRKPTGRT